MIIWLASYPRSGNTLLRTVLKQTMGLHSFSDESVPQQVPLDAASLDAFGASPLSESWDAFYKRASESTQTFLVKTHLMPRDEQPAAYVVRDGRQSLVSYYKYHQKFFPEHAGGLFELALGEDYYGDWSDHYAKWVTGRKNVMLLRYEKLVHASPDYFTAIAKFLGHEGSVSEWVNPFEKLQQASPNFFRVGSVQWEHSPEWTELIDSVFYLRHGDLMQKLGYAAVSDVVAACSRVNPELREFVRSA